MNKRQESGQIIVLLAVSLVVVMMVAALAVDGGMIYSERRFAQNAADASALAGGG
ncbi:MAG: Tad domain-containing protein, partial [Anaerolineaceae bacterium]|nr:Tad domain-containing protein [Anaerolineaceae bacterium]